MADDGTPILFVGALTLDTMYRLPDMPAAAGKYLATGKVQVPAGMASSAAIACARLGGNASLLAAVGDDPVAETLVGALTGAGVDCGLVRRVAGAPSASSTILVDDSGERMVVAHYDPALHGAVDHLAPGALVAFGAAMVDARWPLAAARALQQVAARGGPAIFDLDVGPTADLRHLAGIATHIVASEAGARIAAGTGDRTEALRWLAAACNGFAAITLGGEGCLWLNGPGRETTLSRPPKVKVVDTNAAGDVFHGAFALAVVESMASADAVRFANHAAALKCTRFGGPAGAPDRSEVLALMAADGAGGA